MPEQSAKINHISRLYLELPWGVWAQFNNQIKDQNIKKQRVHDWVELKLYSYS